MVHTSDHCYACPTSCRYYIYLSNNYLHIYEFFIVFKTFEFMKVKGEDNYRVSFFNRSTRLDKDFNIPIFPINGLTKEQLAARIKQVLVFT